jgi:hypothetical protein
MEYALGENVKAQNEANRDELIGSGAFSRDPALKGTFANVEKFVRSHYSGSSELVRFDINEILLSPRGARKLQLQT